MLAVSGCIDAEVRAKADAELAAGLMNSINKTTNELKQDIKAGNDVNNITQTFTKEVLEAIQSTNRTNAWNTSIANLVVLGVMLALIIAGTIVICVFFHRSRVRADTRAQEAQAALRTQQAKFERALAMMPPGEAEKMFPQG